jgi:hypothetical protein
MKISPLAVVAGLLILGSANRSLISADEQQYQGCKIVTNDKGIITSMFYTNLTTYLNIEKEFLFTINNDGMPANCEITFNNGVKRDMKPGEIVLHFAQCGGPNTVWDYYKEHGKVVSYSLDNNSLPYSAFGKVSRLVLRDGREFIGRIGKLADVPDGISLTIDGANGGPISFFNRTVAAVEQMKENSVRS